ncbi:MAG: hypothetical protein AABN95_11950 [Acidobacteriota bacterium]
MAEVAESIKYFYQEFILRDVLSYVTPGAIVAGCVLKLNYGDSAGILLKDLPGVYYIPIFGVLFLIGFALQNLGELLHILKWHDRRNDKTHLQILKTFHSRSKAVGENAEWIERTRERMAVKKIASGTAIMATLISLVLIALKEYYPASLEVAEVLLCLLLVIALYQGHRRQLRAQEFWEDDVTGN